MSRTRLGPALLLAAVFATAFTAGTRAAAEPRSLIDLEVKEKDFQVGMLSRVTRIGRTNALLAGGAAELIFNDVIGVGFNYLSLASQVQPETASDHISVYQMAGVLDLIVGAKHPWHGRFALGIGTITVTGKDLDGEATAARGTTFEPELAWELNLFPHVRVGFGWSYRFAIMPGDSLVSSRKLTGANGLLAVAVGLD